MNVNIQSATYRAINRSTKRVWDTDYSSIEELRSSIWDGFDPVFCPNGKWISSFSVKTNKDLKAFIHTYGIAPEYVMDTTWVFTLTDFIDQSTYEKTREVIAWATDGEILEWIECWQYKKSGRPLDIFVDLHVTTHTFYQVGMFSKEWVILAREFKMFSICQKIDIQKVVAITNCSWTFDKDKNIFIHEDSEFTWSPFQHVLSFTWSIGNTKKFFNDNFQTRFIVEEDVETGYESIDEWVMIKSWQWFTSNDLGYVIFKGDTSIQATEFFVRCHAKICNRDGTITHVISLVNPRTQEETKRAFFPSDIDPKKIVNFFAKFWNFIMKERNISFSMSLFRQIAKADVRDSKAIDGYWFHDGCLILKNGVFNIKHRSLHTQKNNGVLYDEDRKSYVPSSASGWFMTTWLVSIPEFPVNSKNITLGEYWSMAEKMYKDDTAQLVLCYIMWLLGYECFVDKYNSELRVPWIFFHGLAGWGKSEVSNFIKRMFLLPNLAGHNYEGESPFVILSAARMLGGLPYFLSEYRIGNSIDSTKKSFLRNVYDKVSVTKGMRDQTTVEYPLNCHVVLDGQELFQDLALRTRFIKKEIFHTSQIGDYNEFARLQKDEKWEWFFMNYLENARGDEYQKYIEEGSKIFVGMSRISMSYSVLYAGCMCMNPSSELRDQMISVLQKSFHEQQEDYDCRSEYQEVIDMMAYCLENIPDYGDKWLAEWVTHEWRDGFIINWARIVDYASSRKYRTSLDYSTYMSHLSQRWIRKVMCEHFDRMYNGLFFPHDKLPKEFLVNANIYKIQKQFEKKHNQ